VDQISHQECIESSLCNAPPPRSLLHAFPESRFWAAPYVCAGIEREYDEKVNYWPSIYGKESFDSKPPAKPEPYKFSFCVLEGDLGSPICLLGPVQGDAVDHTIFWLPTEKVVITGDAMYGRSTHVWAEEIETKAILEAWQNV
jgi:glyoxylase-like metal-dependent hydrolase (beta-lactamase superfamily II)